MWAQFQKLLSWRKQEYQRVAESELAHVSGSRAGASCALVSPLSIRQGHATPQLLYTLHAAVLSCGLYTDRYAFCLCLQLSVQGMTCSACTSAVENALRCARQKQQTHMQDHSHNSTLRCTNTQQL